MSPRKQPVGAATVNSTIIVSSTLHQQPAPPAPPSPARGTGGKYHGSKATHNRQKSAVLLFSCSLLIGSIDQIAKKTLRNFAFFALK
ncbi:hypothetical protein C7N43_21245 [Sphingobacteriales bacterium UPWRP_1]|nr:hypothetical protein C7N43_21245 [Sphingobacteriales bacterium UPWRP_1]